VPIGVPRAGRGQTGSDIVDLRLFCSSSSSSVRLAGVKSFALGVVLVPLSSVSAHQPTPIEKRTHYGLLLHTSSLFHYSLTLLSSCTRNLKPSQSITRLHHHSHRQQLHNSYTTHSCQNHPPHHQMMETTDTAALTSSHARRRTQTLRLPSVSAERRTSPVSRKQVCNLEITRRSLDDND
jgi:hypothetical protein